MIAAVAVIGLVGLARALARPIQHRFSVSQAFYDRSGTLLRVTLSNDQKYRLWMPLKDFSPLIKKTFLEQEDRYFFWHPGFNAVSLSRALVETYFKKSRRMGASTITMQLARLLYDIDSKTISGKLYQLLRAVELEVLHSKSEILEAYLNCVPMGGNIEGVPAASLIYFHRLPAVMSFEQTAALAVVPQNPSDRNPLRRSTEHRKAWFRLMQRINLASDEAEFPDFKSPAQLPFSAPHFTEHLRGDTVGQPVVSSTLDLKLQTILERRLREYVDQKSTMGVSNAAALVVNIDSGQVLSWIGSKDFFNTEILGQVDGVLAQRSPGSTLKPFVYGLALDQGLIHSRTILKDAPQAFGAFDPENFDRDFKGPVHADDALVQSRNIPAVSLLTKIKDHDLFWLLSEARVANLKDRDHYGLAIALGGAELSMFELASLYRSLALGGRRASLTTELSDSNDHLASDTQLLSPEAAFIVIEMLKKNPPPEVKVELSFVKKRVDVAWKTGTSFGFRDAWAIGIAGQYLVAIWLGNFDGLANSQFIGRDLAGPLFFRFLDTIRAVDAEGLKTARARPVYNVREVDVCAVSGRIPGRHCRHLQKAWFMPGVSPIAECEVHRQISIDVATGLRSCAEASARSSKTEVWEVWPTDLLKVFQRAGLPRRSPPPYLPQCQNQSDSIAALGPEIVSPRTEITYSLQFGQAQHHRVPLQASVDSSAHQLYWFVGAEYLGKVLPSDTVYWVARPGEHWVRVVDDLGRSHSRLVRVEVVR
jgi:penicillin-binding protein 1C